MIRLIQHLPFFSHEQSYPSEASAVRHRSYIRVYTRRRGFPIIAGAHVDEIGKALKSSLCILDAHTLDLWSVFSAMHHDNTRQEAPAHFSNERMLPIGWREGHNAVPRRAVSQVHQKGCAQNSS